MTQSLLERLAELPKAERDRYIRRLASDEAESFEYDWLYRARLNQLPPDGEWRVWLLLAGRGFGKTRTGAEWVRTEVTAGRRRIALVGPTAADVRDVMVEGESGIIAISPPWDMPHYEPSKRRLTWPNGAMATTYSADEPERLRGPQHDAAYCDELGCLVAGTLVRVEHGERPIEDIRSGDLVWTRAGLRRVTAAGPTRVGAPLWRLKVSDGRELIGTSNHPVYAEAFGFSPLRFLAKNDILISWSQELLSGILDTTTNTRVDRVSPLSDRATVYNLEVEGEHEYFANGILVHNSWRYPEAWDMLMFGLRLGTNPRVVVTTTPRPTKLIRELVADPTVAVTRGSTYENRLNLAPAFMAQIIKRYQGTRLGRQELDAELLEDVPGALWTRALIEAARPPLGYQPPTLTRIVVAIDPAATSGEDADETGIVVAGKDDQGKGYVLADLSGHYTPTEWAKVVIAAYKTHGAARVVAEVNNGGEMVENTLRVIDPNVSYTAVRASRGKVIRAEPVAALYEQGRIRHMAALARLEDQMCVFSPDLIRKPGQSPDRVDALVWAFTDLLVEPMKSEGIFELYRQMATQRAIEKNGVS